MLERVRALAPAVRRPGRVWKPLQHYSRWSVTHLDLSSASVFLDFDGTISMTDIGVHLMNRLVGDSWLAIEDLYDRGLIGSRDCVQREWSLLPTADQHLMRTVAAEVEIDPDLPTLIDGLVGAGAEVTVVSDGFGFYVEDAISPLGVPFLTAQADWISGTLSFPYQGLDCPCAECGTCKRAPVQQAVSMGQTTVFVGDGNSDRHAAPLVDVLFAKDSLARWCDKNGVGYRPFSSLRDVAEGLGVLPDK